MGKRLAFAALAGAVGAMPAAAHPPLPPNADVVWVWLNDAEMITRCEPMQAGAPGENPCAGLPINQPLDRIAARPRARQLIPLFENRPKGWEADFDGNPFDWFKDEPIPAEARGPETTGSVAYSLHLTPAGEIADCKIILSSNSPALDAATCSVLRRKGKFRVGHTLGGRPVAGSVGGQVNWSLPGTARAARELDERTTTVEIDTDGTLLSCTAKTTPGNSDLNRNLCETEAFKSKDNNIDDKHSYAAQHVFLTVQTIRTFDGDQPVDEIYKHPGEELMNLLRERYTVAPDGSVTQCEVVERFGRPLARCSYGPFEPDRDQKGVVHATYVVAFSIRPASAPK